MNTLETAKQCGAKVFGDRIVVADGGSSGEATEFCNSFAKAIAEQSLNSRWISVDTALPEFTSSPYSNASNRMLVFNGYYVSVGTYSQNPHGKTEKSRKARWKVYGRIVENITHWQHLPEPPKV